MKRFALALSLAAFFSSAQISHAQQPTTIAGDIPHRISYQGQITSTDGAKVTDGNHTLTVRFYSDGAGKQLVWEDAFKVSTVGGVFSVQLGSQKELPPIDGPLYIGTSIDGTSESFSDRISAAPYAMTVADGAITSRKMGTDYVGSLSLNGQQISGRGSDVKLVTGDGIDAAIDPSTQTIVLKSGRTSIDGAKGGAVEGNTTISGSLMVTGATFLGNSSSSTTIYGDENLSGNLLLASGKTITLPALTASRVVKTDANSKLTTGLVGVTDVDASGTASSSTFLRGDGSWAAVDGLPSQGGNSGKYLITNGASASWANTGLTNFTESVNTSNPNSTVPVVQLLATNAALNVDVALTPKGSGALTAQIANNLTSGGNKRGVYAVDWQMNRFANTQVASGNDATIAGGDANTASATWATVGGGVTNTASGFIATVGGGENNAASGIYDATVSGGASNTASGSYHATVSGGAGNTASGIEASTVSGGYANTASGSYSAIPGGEFLTLAGYDDFGFLSRNNATGNAMTIAANNTAVFGNTDLWLANNKGAASSIKFFEAYSNSGAFPNTAKWVGFQAPAAVTTSTVWTLPVADGSSGQVLKTNGSGALSWVTAGLTNFTESVNTSAPNATVPVVQLLATNAATDVDLALTPKGVGALTAQVANNLFSGGNKRGSYAVDWQMSRNTNAQVASGTYATISGGVANKASSGFATVGGGYGNTASGSSATIGGGESNTASGSFDATVSGGNSNTASGSSATVGGGVGNTASGNYSAIPGGEGMTLSGFDDFGFLSRNNFGGNSMTIAVNNTAVFGNTDLWLANNKNVASSLYFYAPYNTAGSFPNGTKYVGFKAGVVSTSVIWTLPLADGTSGQVLKTDGSGALSWVTPGALTNFTESVNTAAPNATAPVVQLLATNAATNVDVALTPKGAGALTAQVADGTAAGGNKRGQYAVDWQMSRSANTQVASGSYCTVSGGYNNGTSNNYATVAGGDGNTATGNWTAVGGGLNNHSSGSYATVGGGFANNASDNEATVGGGLSNLASWTAATVGGGSSNTASNFAASVGGGSSNTASGTYATVSGGGYAVASHYGQSAQASGAFFAQGDAQSSVYTLRNATTDATSTDLFLDGSSATLAMPANTSWAYHAIVIARNSNGTTDSWEMRGNVTYTVGVNVTEGTTTHVGSSAYTVNAVPSGTNIVFRVAGGAGQNIHWVARLETAEATY